MITTRRAAIAGGLALAACGGDGVSASQKGGSATGPSSLDPLKSRTSFPVGVAAMTGQLDDAGWSRLASTHFGRLTPEWEMKMEAFLGEGDRLDFSRADRICAWARQQGLQVFGHTLVWYAQGAPRFERLNGSRRGFAEAYRTYIRDICDRYRGQVTGWDVVNEPVEDDNSGDLRECIWSRNLGQTDYVRLAFEHAREADPDAELFLNDYNLETYPRKLDGFMRLAETLLEAGAPLTGLGTQTHVDCSLPDGAIQRTVDRLASLGLKVHVSEIDVSTATGDPARQGAIFAEAAEAMRGLPQAQQFGVTVWGVRDSDSWLRRADWHNPPEPDNPLLFDDNGRPKASAQAFADALG